MFDFGIEGYRPAWGNGLADAMTHAARMRALIGRRLTDAWLVWDLEHGEWWADCPVLLDFEGEQIEINHQKFDDLSITWNSADPAKPVIWPTSDNFQLAWRNTARPDLVALRGRTVQAVEFLVWTGSDMANGSIAVGFTFGRDRLCVFNALDENGLEVGTLQEQWQSVPLGT
ncbi:hypothetical protein [Saccharothrix variisporea]|uniref:Uncharacterized protein n=1 Tax=Saccharothrix variisporea TaxID=543527 RepID=A0A495XCR5_9PSEU|nr:hypothetical protein [Saccharothrix variisporea]RKT70885.1 hypothetical protein DFJ66_4162 [Saccharothrix variisporea]